MDKPLSRRAWLVGLASSAGAVVAACGGSALATREIDTPEGRVVQWEGEDLLALVSGLQSTYHAGQPIEVNVLLNNQSTKVAQVRLRTKLLGRGDQTVAEDQATVVTVKPEDASSVQRTIPLPRSLVPGEHTLLVEIPPWELDGRETGRGAQIRARVMIEPPAGASS